MRMIIRSIFLLSFLSIGSFANAMCDAIVGPVEVCVNDVLVKYHVNSNPSCLPATFTWSINATTGTAPSIVSGTESMDTVQINAGASAGTFELEVIFDPDPAGMPDTLYYTVTVAALPNNTLAISDDSVCDGDDATITITASESGVMYQLRNNADNSFVGSSVTGTGSDLNLTFTPLADGTIYNVLATLGSCGVVMMTMPAITVHSLPTATAGGPYADLCEDAAVITVTGTPTDAGGSWVGMGITDNSDGTASFDPDGLSGSITIIYSYTDGNSCDATPASTTITVNDLPTISANGPYGPLCEADTPIALTGTPEDSGGAWSGMGVTDNGDGTATFDPDGLAGSNVLTYSYTDPTTMCTNTDVMTTITVNASAVFVDLTTVCDGATLTSVTVNATSSGSMEYREGGSGAYQMSPMFTGLTAGGTYTFEIRTVGTTCVTSSGPIMVDCVCPTINNNDISASQTICYADTPMLLDGLTVTTTPPGASFNYRWQSSLSGMSGTWSDIGSSDTEDYNPGSLTTTTHYRRQVLIPGCNDSSTPVIITVNNGVSMITAGGTQTICANETSLGLGGVITLTNGSSGTGTWSSSAGGSFSGSGNLNATWTPASNFDGTATLTLTANDPDDTGPCAGGQTTTVTVNVNVGVSTIDAGSNQTICANESTSGLGGSITLTDGSSGSGTWTASQGGGSFSSPTNLNATYTPPNDFTGSIILTLTANDPDSGGPCLGNQTSTTEITVNNGVDNVTTGGPQTICAGESTTGLGGAVNLINGTTGTGVWTSSQAGGSFSPNANANNPTYSPSTVFFGAITLTYTANDPDTGGPCVGGQTSTVALTVNRGVSAISAGADQTICANGTTTGLMGEILLTGETAGNGTGSGVWSDGGQGGSFSPNANALNPTYTPANNFNGSIILTFTANDPDAAGPCMGNQTATVNLTVTVGVSSVATGMDQTPCSNITSAPLGGEIMLTDGTNGTGMWTSSQAGGTFSPNANTLDATYTPPFDFTGNITLTLTANDPDGSGPCPSGQTSTLMLTVNPTPIFSSIEVNCTGANLDDVVVLASISSGTLEYRVGTGNWQSSNVFTGLTVGQSYNFEIRDDASLCNVFSGMTEVNCSCPTVSMNTVTDNQALCFGESAAIIIGTTPTTNPVTPSTFQWEAKPIGGNYGDIPGATAKDYDPGNVGTTTEFRRKTVIDGCPPFNSNSVVITVNPLPTITTGGTYGPLCENSNSITLNGTPENNGGTWSGEGVTDNGDGTAIFNPSGLMDANIVTYNYVDPATNCTNSPASTSITVNFVPDFTINSTKGDEICYDDFTTLFSSVSNPDDYEFIWTLPDNSNKSDKEILANLPGLYTLQLESSGCTKTATFTLKVNTVDASLETNPMTSTVCQGDSVQLSVAGTFAHIYWTNPPIDDDIPSVWVKPTTVSSSYSLVIESGFGCTADAAVSFNVNVPEVVEIGISPNQAFYCEDTPLTISSNAGFSNWDWSTTPGVENVPSQSILANPAVEQYSLTAVDGNNCSNSDEIDIDVRSRPTVEIFSLDVSVFTGDPITFEAIDVTFDPLCSGIETYVWTFLDKNGNVVNTPINTGSTAELTTSFVSLDTIITQVQLVATDGCGCVNAEDVYQFSVLLNGLCSGSFEFPAKPCLGEISTFIADPKPGNTGGQPEIGYFIIDGLLITKDKESTTAIYDGINGQFKVGSVLENAGFNNFHGEIEIEFLDDVCYFVSYYVQFANCFSTSNVRKICVNPIPTFAENGIMIDQEACDGESPRITFSPNASEFDWDFDFVATNGGGAGTQPLKDGSPNNDLVFEDVSGDDIIISFGELIDNETGCANDEYNSLQYVDTIKVFDPLGIMREDSCDLEFDSIFYKFLITGGTGQYSITNTNQLNDSLFISDALLGGSIKEFAIEDEGCDDPYIINQIVMENCENCFAIQDFITDNSITVPSRMDICDNDTATYKFSEPLDDFLPDSKTILYVFQSSTNQAYNPDNVVYKFTSPDINNLSEVDIHIDLDDTLRSHLDLGLNLFLTAYAVTKTANLTPAAVCLGLTTIPVEFYEAPTPAIDATLEDNTICQNEIDYQIGVNTDASENIWSSNDAGITIRYEAGAGRALIDLDSSTASTASIILDQINNYNTPSGNLVCENRASIELDVLSMESPSKDSIIWWPGNFLTYSAAGLTYQWGWTTSAGVEMLATDPSGTTQFYIHDEEIGDNIMWVDVYGESDQCITRVYYNAVGPPGKGYTPDADYSVRLYPNPNDGQFILELDGEQSGLFTATVFNYTGALVHLQQFEKSDELHQQIFDLSTLDSGLYVIQVLDQGGYRHVMKLIKQ